MLKAGNVGGELLNWIAMLGAIGNRKPNYVAPQMQNGHAYGCGGGDWGAPSDGVGLTFPLIPAQAGIQEERADVRVNLTGSSLLRRFRGDERMRYRSRRC